MNPNTQLDSLYALIADDMLAVDRVVRERLHSDVVLVRQVAEYIIAGGGKRMRPALVVLVAGAVGYQGRARHELAAIVEFIHTATLLHDDVVDESAQRRGRPTANLLWDNKSSVLVGDYLFARAFQLMVEPGNLRALTILSNAAAEIAEGEVLQLTAAQDIATTEDTYMRVIRGKTAALFSAATQVGPVIAGSPEVQVQALFDYGDALGICFQIVDDFLDYGGAGDRLGKNLGDDFREGKLTLPVIRAIAAADAEERAFWDRTIGRGQQAAGDLEQAMALLARHGALDSTRQAALDWAARARDALAPLPDHPLKTQLADLAGYVVARVT